MKTRLMLLAVAVTAAGVSVAGASAQVPGAPRQVEDACGDADSRATTAGQSLRLEAGDPSRDLDGARFGIVYPAAGEALVAEVDTCGKAVGAVHTLLQIGLEDRCVLNVEYAPRRLHEGVAEPQVRVSETCFDNSSSPTARPREVGRTTLPASAAAFTGNTTRITVPLRELATALLPRFAPGTIWRSSAVVLADPEAGNFAQIGGTDPQPDASVYSRFDFAQGSGYVVGQDAPQGD